MTHELDTVHDHALEVRTHATLCLTFNLMTCALRNFSSQSYSIYYSHPCPHLNLPYLTLPYFTLPKLPTLTSLINKVCHHLCSTSSRHYHYACSVIVDTA